MVLGTVTPLSILEKVTKAYDGGIPDGVDCGYNEVKLKLVRKRLCVLTGIPSSGKSNWLDCVMLNTAASDHWHWVIFSPENDPVERHVAGLCEKLIGKRFFESRDYARMDKSELQAALRVLDKHFTFVSLADNVEPNIVNICGVMSEVIKTRRAAGMDVQGVVIDPYNEIEHNRTIVNATKNMSETEYVSHFLSKLRRWTRSANVFTCLVAHPTKLPRKKDHELKAGENPYSCPTPYDISGSSHFRNKADICVAVHRPNITGVEVDVYVQKVRFREDGEICKGALKYVVETASYSDFFNCIPDVSLARFNPKQEALF